MASKRGKSARSSARSIAKKPAPARRAASAPRTPPTSLTRPAEALPIRIGHGYDLHRLEVRAPAGPGRPMIVGGIILDDPTFDRGPVAHSDGDVLYHAVTDALLGALALPDIGQLFPDTAKAHEGQDSADFLSAAMNAVHGAGYAVGNLDCTVILQKPKLSPVKESIRDNLARLLRVERSRVNIKGKTHEHVDAVGESRAVEAHAVVTLLLR